MPLTQSPLGVPAQDLLSGREGDFWPALPTEYDDQSWVATEGQRRDCPALSEIKQEGQLTLPADEASAAQQAVISSKANLLTSICIAPKPFPST